MCIVNGYAVYARTVDSCDGSWDIVSPSRVLHDFFILAALTCSVWRVLLMSWVDTISPRLGHKSNFGLPTESTICSNHSSSMHQANNFINRRFRFRSNNLLGNRWMQFGLSSDFYLLLISSMKSCETRILLCNMIIKMHKHSILVLQYYTAALIPK